ncbi:CDIF630_02480 family spore surface protein [[Clostridium] polysaccharolyticum]|uniref:DUF3787 domain-containing protein n=1 Tax=[Clostridium] polysaccharolyticum TaxID=29364 RepID=A0A1I0CKC4_9FIRM|nr:DUF3787 domain-containing protein [[Clostridium] polysaccharolyticum]SET19862.1 protein of unknown function [[Clostridium] polysaccharolyticum]
MEFNVAEGKVKNNARSFNTKTRISQTTAALAEHYKATPEANVTIPSGEAVSEAKDWVDNGSKL